MRVHVLHNGTFMMSCSSTPSGIDARYSVSCWRESASRPLSAEIAMSESRCGSCALRQSGPETHLPCTQHVKLHVGAHKQTQRKNAVTASIKRLRARTRARARAHTHTHTVWLKYSHISAVALVSML